MNNLFDFLANAWPYLFTATVVAAIGVLSFFRWFIALKDDKTGTILIPFILLLLMIIVVMISVPFGTIGIICDMIRWGANLA